jgi:arsenate reductase-like glutaredoxin family protein
MGHIDTENDKLETICKHYGIELNAHNALDDIIATKRLNDLLTKQYIHDKKVFDEKERLYRENCQAKLSESRLKLSAFMSDKNININQDKIQLNINEVDRLVELEKQIMEYYLSKGYALEDNMDSDGNLGWHFKVDIHTRYKYKAINVCFFADGGFIPVFTVTEQTTKEMYDKAFEYFKLEEA